MSKRRNADFDGENDFFGFIPMRSIKSLGVSDIVALVVFLWVIGMGLHIAYNVHIGIKDSKIHIEKQAQIHEWCNENELARELNFETCKRARVERDLSVPWTTVNYVLHHTNICIVTSCYEVLTDLSGRLGWLLIGIGLIISVVLFILRRNNAHVNSMYINPEATNIRLLEDRVPMRLREVKGD